MTKELSKFTPKLAIADSMWSQEAGFDRLAILPSLGFSGVVVSPERISVSYADMSTDMRAYTGYAMVLKDLGLELVALRDVIPATDRGQIFGEKERQEYLLDRLRLASDIAAEMGASSLSFGAPELRNGAFVKNPEDLEIGASFFKEVSEVAHEAGVRVMLESCAQGLGCDFGTTLAEVATIVSEIDDAQGLGIHLNTSSLLMEEDMPRVSIVAHGASSHHVEICDPFFRPVSDRKADDHVAIGSSLSRLRDNGHGPRFLTLSGRADAIQRGVSSTSEIISSTQKIKSFYL
jgi:sugar phosphate isomerase/epimerase